MANRAYEYWQDRKSIVSIYTSFPGLPLLLTLRNLSEFIHNHVAVKVMRSQTTLGIRDRGQTGPLPTQHPCDNWDQLYNASLWTSINTKTESDCLNQQTNPSLNFVNNTDMTLKCSDGWEREMRKKEYSEMFVSILCQVCLSRGRRGFGA